MIFSDWSFLGSQRLPENQSVKALNAWTNSCVTNISLFTFGFSFWYTVIFLAVLRFIEKENLKQKIELQSFDVIGFYFRPNWHLLFQNQKWKHQNNVWNLFKVIKKRPKWRQWRRSSVFLIIFEQVSHIVWVSPLLTLNK